jgi:SM-20-related protein
MVNIKDNIFPSEILNPCISYINNGNWSYGWHSNKNLPYSHWNLDISKTPRDHMEEVKHTIPEEFQKVWDVLNKEMFFDKGILVRCYSNRHTFGTEGYIHTDTERDSDFTCVIYLNKKWDADWGGETSFFTHDNSEIVAAVLPKFGRVVVFPGNLPHCARPVTKMCNEVRTTLMFKVLLSPEAFDEVEGTLRRFLSDIGAHKKKHKKGSLADHLIRCFRTVRGMGGGDILALAAGLHSVYGTNVFKNSCLAWEDQSVKTLFGDEVDRIVRLFGSINRPEALENPDGSLSDMDLFLLRCIECVNLFDQKELSSERFPNLYQFAAQFGQQT